MLEHNRHSTRLQGYDYSSPGFYFITICTKNRINYFGKIILDEMRLSETGRIALNCWKNIPKHYTSVKIDEYIIMPDHVHGILKILYSNNSKKVPGKKKSSVGVENFQPLRNYYKSLKPFYKTNKYQKIIPRSIGCIVRGYKIGVVKSCKNTNFQWQRNYQEHIIRDHEELEFYREYIKNNILHSK